MSDLAALVYLETRMGINRFGQVLRQPGRLVLWLLFFAWIGLFFYTRLAAGYNGAYGIFMPDSMHRLIAFIPSVYLIILGIEIRSGSRRPPATFAYPADARFLLGSRLPQLLVVLWLQLRELSFSGSRLFLGLFFVCWNFAGTAGGLVTATFVLLMAYIIAIGIRMPVFLAQRRWTGLPFASFGVTLAVAGMLTLLFPVALAVVSHNVRFSFMALHAASFPPGSWIVQALAGDRLGLLVLGVLATTVLVGSSVAARDAYPEIWEASSRLYALRALVASGRGLWNREAFRALRDSDHTKAPVRIERVASSTGARVPAGALTLVWKEWISLRRSPGGLTWPVFWTIAASALGVLFGIVASNVAFLIIVGPAVAVANIVIIIGSQSTINLGAELRKPVWWLAHSVLRERILAWIAATALRIGPALIAGALCAGIAMRSTLVVLLSAPVIVVGLFLVQSIGVASYVVLPGRGDLRGPGFMLRIFATYFSLIPAAIAWGIAAALTQSLLAGAISGLVVAALQGWLAAVFASRKLEENAMAYAALEQR